MRLWHGAEIRDGDRAKANRRIIAAVGSPPWSTSLCLKDRGPVEVQLSNKHTSSSLVKPGSFSKVTGRVDKGISTDALNHGEKCPARKGHGKHWTLIAPLGSATGNPTGNRTVRSWPLRAQSLAARHVLSGFTRNCLISMTIERPRRVHGPHCTRTYNQRPSLDCKDPLVQAKPFTGEI